MTVFCQPYGLDLSHLRDISEVVERKPSESVVAALYGPLQPFYDKIWKPSYPTLVK